MITLREVTKENYLDCIHLQLKPDQENNLASNAISIAQSKYEKRYQTRAIYNDEKVVGFLTYCHKNTPGETGIYLLFRGYVPVNSWEH